MSPASTSINLTFQHIIITYPLLDLIGYRCRAGGRGLTSDITSKASASKVVGGWTIGFQEKKWLVVSTHLKNIGQIGSFPQVGMKLNHHL